MSTGRPSPACATCPPKRFPTACRRYHLATVVSIAALAFCLTAQAAVKPAVTAKLYGKALIEVRFTAPWSTGRLTRYYAAWKTAWCHGVTAQPVSAQAGRPVRVHLISSTGFCTGPIRVTVFVAKIGPVGKHRLVGGVTVPQS